MAKTIEEINEKIKKGKAVVFTAAEMKDFVARAGVKHAARKVDVVTTATFGPMCSSGAYLNFGHSRPRIKIGGGKCLLNEVPAYTGLAAVDVYIGATSIPDDDPRNTVFPGEFRYGGGHVIHDLVAGKDVKLDATAYGTNCYPRRNLATWINIRDINDAILFNPRNAYQNYNVAANLSNEVIYTYMGMLKPRLGNANYCSAGQISPLLNDPHYRTIGIGTKIFLGGGVGYVAWHGTQHNPSVKRKHGVPRAGAGTLALIGDLKQMKPEWLVGVSFIGYGASLAVGIGVPIPVLDEEMAKYTAVRDEQIWAQVIDYSRDYPGLTGKPLAEVNYAQLKSGRIIVKGRSVPTASLSSYYKATEITEILKKWIVSGHFLLTKPVAQIPGAESGISFKPLKERPIHR